MEANLPDKWWAWRDRDGYTAYDVQYPRNSCGDLVVSGEPALSGTRREIMEAVGKEFCVFIRTATQ